MDFETAEIKALLFCIIALAAGLAAGWLAEKLLLGRLKRLAQQNGRSVWRSWRGLGVFAGLLLAMFVILQRQYLPEYWQTQAWLAWKILVVIVGTVYTARILSRLVEDSTRDLAGALHSVSLLEYILRGTIYALGLLIILHALGISITPMLTALGVGGLAVALALQDTLSNLFSGIQIIASRKIQPGQFIRLEGGQEGYVSDINWRSTIIRTLPNMLVIVPNKTLASSIVVNTFLPDAEVSVPVECGVDYSSDLDFVERVALETATEVQNRVAGAVKGHVPTFRWTAFGPSSMDFRIMLRATEYEEQFPLRHEMIKALHKRFRQESINIPFPVRTLQFDDSTLEKIKK